MNIEHCDLEIKVFLEISLVWAWIAIVLLFSVVVGISRVVEKCTGEE